jgi:hypothetical protein
MKMGLGKTRQAVVALRQAAEGGPYLVVCPASVKRNWERARCLPGRPGTGPRRTSPASLPPCPFTRRAWPHAAVRTNPRFPGPHKPLMVRDL